MSIGQVFNRGLDGLVVNQRGLAVTANNIANINTKGYARQEVIIGTRPSSGDGYSGGGAVVLGVNSIVNPFVELQLFSTANDFGTVDGRRRTVLQLESVYNEATGFGLGKAMSDFFSAWSDLANDASSSASRNLVKQRGIALATRFNQMSRQLSDMRRDLSSEIETRLGEINSLAENIADLNRAIANASDPNAVKDLEAQRTYYLRQLSEEVTCSYYIDSNTNVAQVQIGGGGSLVNNFEAGSLSLTDNLGAGGTAEIDLTLPGSSTSIDITSGITSGRLGGNLIDRNTTLNTQISDLDTLAYEFARQFNAIHTTGFGLQVGLDGNLDGHDFFVATGGSATGYASTIALDAEILNNVNTIAAAGSDPTNSGDPNAGVGDNTIALQLIALQSDTTTMSGGTQSFSGYYQTLVSGVGTLSAGVQREYASQSTLLNQMEIQREGVSGVNMDEEGANLIRYQRAFQASSKLLMIADEMLGRLLEI